MARRLDVTERLNKAMASLSEANRLDRFDERLAALSSIMRQTIEEILTISDSNDNLKEQD